MAHDSKKREREHVIIMGMFMSSIDISYVGARACYHNEDVYEFHSNGIPLGASNEGPLKSMHTIRKRKERSLYIVVIFFE